MSIKLNTIEFHSPIAFIIKQFIEEKRICGYKYDDAPNILKKFDEFLYQKKLKRQELPQELVIEWLNQKPKEKAMTQQRRVSLVRQLAKMMARLDYSAYIVPAPFGAQRSYTFKPRVYTKNEVKKLIYAADQIKPCAKSPMRHLIIPEIFRLLYGCGFRISEVLNLRVRDVDLIRGVITIRDGKFNVDRLVPPALDMVKRLQIYAKKLEKYSLQKIKDDDFFFPSFRQTAWSVSGIYVLFLQMLHQCKMPHAGRGKGPRIHDFRHTFAVHRLIQWYEEGSDLTSKLPLLVTYMGHKDITGTQKYLHLTAELFPNLTKRMNEKFGDAIPLWR